MECHLLLKSLPETVLSKLLLAFKQLYSSVRSSVLYFFLLLVSVSLLTIKFGVRPEDVQVVVFPFICLLLVALPLKSQYRPPLLLAIVSVALWAISTINMNIVQPRNLDNVDAFVLSRLSKDDNSVFVRQFIKRYEIIANTYGLPPAQALAKELDGEISARNWLAKQSKHHLFLVRGFQSWLEIVFNSSLRWQSDSKLITSLAEFNSTTESSSKLEQLEVIEFRVPWVPNPLLLATLPESINSPAEPREFVLHALGWLSKSLSLRPIDSAANSETNLSIQAQRLDALAQLSFDASIGLSNGVAAIGQYLHALSILEEYRQQGYQGEARIDEAIALIRNAAKFVKMESDPELFSMLFNNAGVAAMSVAQTPDELYKARFWIRVANDASQFGKKVPLGSQIAMKNLIILDEAEAVSPVILEPYSKDN